jgi:hypothetical protein
VADPIPHPRRSLRRAALAACVTLACLAAPAPARQDHAQDPATTGSITFGSELPAALESARASKRLVVAVFGAVWCPFCARLLEETIASPEVRGLAQDYVWVYVDVDLEVSLAREHDVTATPTTLVLGPDGTTLARATGAPPGAAYRDFLESVRTAAEGKGPMKLSDGDSTKLTWSPDGFRGLSVCFSHVGYGPLSLPSQAPGQLLRLGLHPRTPSTLARGQFELNWTESFANIWGYEENQYRLDYLTLNSTLALAYGLSDQVGIELAFGNLIRTNSFLDPITTGFHDLFGFGAAGRDEFPEGENVIEFLQEDGTQYHDTSSGSDATNLALSLQHTLTCGTDVWPALAYSITGRWDAGGNADLEGPSPFSVGLSLSAARRLGDDFYAYLGGGYVWHGQDEARGVHLKDEQWNAFVALEWRYKANRSFVVQYLASEGVAVEVEPFSESSNEIDLGWKWEFEPGTVFEIGLIENLIEFDNSPDFGVHFGLRHRF